MESSITLVLPSELLVYGISQHSGSTVSISSPIFTTLALPSDLVVCGISLRSFLYCRLFTNLPLFMWQLLGLSGTKTRLRDHLGSLM
ncbi:hypothetical protein PoB_005193100 [Plakobranchus ocellatus]|uniref:Uncharacterized protein n=1 Tax=Plakobranchus ocellatus TaxID=259542 RepID=A0AAV4C218_9GAST|nr:hypothetical protein PoB_005193100 [Plakobranchus ocellatus]